MHHPAVTPSRDTPAQAGAIALPLTTAREAPPDKRALCRQYKEAQRQMGVFTITNTVNGRVYVGASTNLEAAMNRSRFELQMRTHRNRALLQDWLVHGAGQFRFEVVDLLAEREDASADVGSELDALRDLWCDELGAYGDRGYMVPAQARQRKEAP